MNATGHDNLFQFISAGTYPVDIQHGPRYLRANFRRKASHFRVEGKTLYKVRMYGIISYFTSCPVFFALY